MHPINVKRTVISAAIASAAMLTAAQAQTIGTAVTDLNLRSGPDPQFPVIGMIRENQRATVLGCIEGSRWCQVDVRGRTGWAYSQYMTMTGDMAAILPAPEIEVDVAARPVIAPPPAVAYRAPAVTYQAPVYQAPAPVVAYRDPVPALAYPYPAPAVTYQPPVVAYQTAPNVTYTAPSTVGAAPRDFAGRLIAPRETIYASTTLPRAYVPPRLVRTYITTNPLETVWLEGSLMVGAGLPDNIQTIPVPGSRYDYAYVNDYPVLVDPGTRRVVYVSR